MRWPLTKKEPQLRSSNSAADRVDDVPDLQRSQQLDQRYAFALKWVPAATASTVKDEARKTATSDKAQLFAVRADPPVMPQYAVAAADQAAQPGMIAAAAVIASHFGGTFIAAIPLPDQRFWIVAADGGILREPEPDILLPDHGAARAYLFERLNRIRADYSADDTRVYAPAAWHDDCRGLGVEVAEEVDVWPILAAAKAPKLQLVRRSSLPVVLGLAAVALVAAAGGFAYFTYQEAETARLEAARFNVERRARAEVEQSFAPPWARRPSPKTVLAACYRAFGQLYINVDGWRARQLRCHGGTTVEVEWLQLRKSAPVGALKAAMAKVPAAIPVNLTPAGNSITYQMALTLPDAELAKEPVLKPLEAQLAMLNAAQTFNIGLTIESRKEEQPPVPSAARRMSAPPAVPTFRWTEWTSNSSTDPRLLPIADMPGVVVNNVVLAPDRVEWIVKGAIYDPR